MAEPKSNIPEVKLPEGGFQSKIPEHILHDRPESERYLLEAIGKLNHFTDWAAPILISVNQEVRKTNGRVTKNEIDIERLKSNDNDVNKIARDLKQIVGTKRLIEKIAASKFTWVGLFIFGVGFITVLKNETLRNAIMSILGL